jgi:hypothetical protein
LTTIAESWTWDQHGRCGFSDFIIYTQTKSDFGFCIFWVVFCIFELFDGLFKRSCWKTRSTKRTRKYWKWSIEKTHNFILQIKTWKHLFKKKYTKKFMK